MSGFDPNAYLASKKSNSGFDPNAYLSSKRGDPTEVLEESADFIDWADRAKVKNFSNSNENTVKYLQQKYPDKVFSVIDDEVVARDINDKKWKKLDSNKLEFSDITDLGYDVASGIAEGAATAAGGLMGLGAGSLPFAMAGNAVASGGTEYLRQKLGEALGVNDEVKGMDVALSGALGGLTVGVLGDAKTNGIVKKVWDKGADVGEMLTGVGKKHIKTYANNIDEIDDMFMNGAEPIVNSLNTKVKNLVDSRKKDANDLIQSSIDNATELVDVSSSKNKILNRLNELRSKVELTPKEAREAQQIATFYNDTYGLEKSIPADARKLLETDDGKRLYASLDEILNQKNAVESIGQSLPKTNNQITPDYTGGGLMGDYSRMPDPKIEDFHESLAKEAQTLDGKMSKTVGAIDSLRDKYARTHVADKMPARRAFELQQQTNKDAMWGVDIDSIPADIRDKVMAARDASMSIKDSLDKATGGESSVGKMAYKEAKELESFLEPLADDKSAYKNIIGLDSRQRQLMQERLKKLIDSGDLDIGKEIDLVQAFDKFKNSSGRSAPIATGLSSLLTLAGYTMGGGYAGAAIGGLAGAKIGSKIGSPEYLKKMIKTGKKIDKWADNSKVLKAINNNKHIIVPLMNEMQKEGIRGLND